MDVKHMNTDRLLARVETAAPSDGLQRKIKMRDVRTSNSL